MQKKFNLAEKLHNSMVSSPDTKLVFEDKVYTFSEVDEMIRKTATFLSDLGIKKGDRIAIQLPKSMEFIYFHLANLTIGAVTLPLNIEYSEEEIEYFLKDSESSLFISYPEKYEKLKRMLNTLKIETILAEDVMQKIEKLKPFEGEYKAKGDDTAIIGYTSGTTGRSKGAMITHNNLVLNMEALRKAWRWTQNDILLHTLPLFHFHGLGVALHGALNAKSKIIMHKKFDPIRVWQTIEKEKITMFMGVPTLYYRLTEAWKKMDRKPDISSMRVFISGSAPLSERLFYEFEKLTGHRILERYGMTEAGMIASNPYEEDKRIPKSVGYALEGCTIKIIKDGRQARPNEVGEVYIKGNNVFKGYWRMPQKTEESFKDGWFITGDMGYMDETGRLFLVGRSKNMIISGGYNVYPKEVEYALEEHPCVVESFVFGMEDEDFGERVEALVKLKENGCAKADEIIKFCKDKIAHYKCPKKVYIVDEIPKNTMGKVVLKKVKEMIKDGKISASN